jgi:hypothetical protein
VLVQHHAVDIKHAPHNESLFYIPLIRSCRCLTKSHVASALKPSNSFRVMGSEWGGGHVARGFQ